MEDAGFFGIGHVDLSVSDVEVSATWYEHVLGLRRLRRTDFPERTMIVLRHDASGLVVGLNQHRGFHGGPFDERRAGLDHVGFAVGRRQDLYVWQERLAALDVEHSPVADTEVGSASSSEIPITSSSNCGGPSPPGTLRHRCPLIVASSSARARSPSTRRSAGSPTRSRLPAPRCLPSSTMPPVHGRSA